MGIPKLRKFIYADYTKDACLEADNPALYRADLSTTAAATAVNERDCAMDDLASNVAAKMISQNEFMSFDDDRFARAIFIVDGGALMYLQELVGVTPTDRLVTINSDSLKYIHSLMHDMYASLDKYIYAEPALVFLLKVLELQQHTGCEVVIVMDGTRPKGKRNFTDNTRDIQEKYLKKIFCVTPTPYDVSLVPFQQPLHEWSCRKAIASAQCSYPANITVLYAETEADDILMTKYCEAVQKGRNAYLVSADGDFLVRTMPGLRDEGILWLDCKTITVSGTVCCVSSGAFLRTLAEVLYEALPDKKGACTVDTILHCLPVDIPLLMGCDYVDMLGKQLYERLNAYLKDKGTRIPYVALANVYALANELKTPFASFSSATVALMKYAKMESPEYMSAVSTVVNMFTGHDMDLRERLPTGLRERGISKRLADATLEDGAYKPTPHPRPSLLHSKTETSCPLLTCYHCGVTPLTAMLLKMLRPRVGRVAVSFSKPHKGAHIFEEDAKDFRCLDSPLLLWHAIERSPIDAHYPGVDSSRVPQLMDEVHRKVKAFSSREVETADVYVLTALRYLVRLHVPMPSYKRDWQLDAILVQYFATCVLLSRWVLPRNFLTASGPGCADAVLALCTMTEVYATSLHLIMQLHVATSTLSVADLPAPEDVFPLQHLTLTLQHFMPFLEKVLQNKAKPRRLAKHMLLSVCGSEDETARKLWVRRGLQCLAALVATNEVFPDA